MHASAIWNDRRRPARRGLLQAVGAALGTLAVPSWVRAMAAEPANFWQGSRRLAFSLDGLGPRLVAAGVIDPARFIEACARAGAPLTARSRKVLTDGGLANANAVLTRGPMMRNGMGRIFGYASTGGCRNVTSWLQQHGLAAPAERAR